VRIVQVLSPTSTAFELTCQKVDFEALRADHDVTIVASAKEADPCAIGHFYAPRKQTIVWLGKGKRWFAKRPTVAISPVQETGFSLVPEAVEERYFESSKFEVRSSNSEFALRTSNFELASVGVLGRPALKNMINQVIARVHRTREDIDFLVFDEAPTPDELRKLNVWMDPALDDHDFDGFVAQAVVCGLPVVASRTKINAQRLEQGRTGWLAPPGDPNELTHAILSALFKPEVARQKIDAARQTASKFRPRQRLRALTAIYESLLP
jgi:glycosyltransferase involved in cell wall biosynthesis